MKDMRQHMYQHLRSAKQWLTQAESALDQKSEVRAELHLMLAEAELQRVKEAKSLRHKRFSLFVRHSTALFAAFCLLSAGIAGSYWWLKHPVAETHVPAAKAVEPQTPLSAVSIQPVTLEKPALPNEVVIASPPASGQTAPSAQKVRPQEMIPADNEPIESPAPVLSSAEKQNLVRAAGKKLRGQ